MSRKLTIGMVTYDDFDGVWFTIQSLRLFHAEAMDDVEFLILDNNPDSKHGEALSRFSAWLRPQDRLFPVKGKVGTAVRQQLFELARTDWLMCLDCHVLVSPSAVTKLIDFFRDGRDEGCLLQGPLLMDNLKKICTHFDPVWRAGMWGIWAEDERGLSVEGAPFEIPSQGLGLFACSVASWPGFNPRFRGFGGEEGYIHEKFRQLGRRTICLPWLRWCHRFERPNGTPYPNVWGDRIFNYTVGHLELDLPLDEMKDHFISLGLGVLVDECLIEAQGRTGKA
jgi:hypothetical protein